MPNLIALATAIACGGKDSVHEVEALPAKTKQAMSYGSLLAGYFLTFGGTVSDFAVYHHPDTSEYVERLTIYVSDCNFALHILGPVASFSLAAHPLGCHRRRLAEHAFVVRHSVVANMALSMYSVTLNLQMMIPVFVNIPRIAFIMVAMAIMVPMAIHAAGEG